MVFRRFLRLTARQRSGVLRVICFILLSYNIYRYASRSIALNFLRIPVEFSAVSYFAVPLIVLLNLKFLKSWAAYSALLAGGGYFIAIALFGNAVYANGSTDGIVAALFCHGMLFICGLLLISEKRFSHNSSWALTIGLCYVGLRALLLRQRFSGGAGIFIYELLFALRPVKLFGGNILPVYYSVLFLLVTASFKIFYSMNLKMAKK